jgi:hypothetical protein
MHFPVHRTAARVLQVPVHVYHSREGRVRVLDERLVLLEPPNRRELQQEIRLREVHSDREPARSADLKRIVNYSSHINAFGPASAVCL